MVVLLLGGLYHISWQFWGSGQKEYEDIFVDSLWIVDRRDSSGVHNAGYWGNFIPQIPYQMMRRYTKKGDWILDTFAGQVWEGTIRRNPGHARLIATLLCRAAGLYKRNNRLVTLDAAQNWCYEVLGLA